jgi:hypothetical protein
VGLRDWPPRAIGRMWLWGILLQVIVAGTAYMIARINSPPVPPELARIRGHNDRVFAEMRAHDDSVARGELAPPQPLTAEQKARLRRSLDSVGITVRRHGDTLTVTGPPVLDSIVWRAFMGIDRAMRRLMWILAGVFLPIPTVLLSITGAWAVLRLRSRATDLGPAV